MSLLDHPLIGARYFFPRSDAADPARVVETRDGDTLRCAFHDAGDGRTLVHFHGNGEVVSDWTPTLGPLFAQLGWSTLFVEYRGYGGSSGAPALSAMRGDGEDALRALGLDPARTVAFGRSIGSLYAVELCARQPLAGLVLDSGIHDLHERLALRVTDAELGGAPGALEAAARAEFDQGRKLRDFAGPTLLLHAADDELVRLHHAEANAAEAQRATLAVFERGGHNAIFFTNVREYVAALAEFLASIDA